MPDDAPPKLYTSKQMGDACEMLIAAELTLAGVPAIKAPDFWPGYDVIAQTSVGVQKVSVKSRTFKRGPAFVRFKQADDFDWLAIVILPSSEQKNRRVFIIPREVALEMTMTNKAADGTVTRDFQVDRVATKLGPWENNFTLRSAGSAADLTAATS